MTTIATSPRVAATAHAGGAGEPPPRVPWTTVLPLAVVAAFGSGFWLVVIRGAVGSVERTQSPFTVWLEESTLLLPLYVFAVLAALTLALRRHGAGPHRPVVVASTLLLVALAVTLAAAVVAAVSAVYDYRLQDGHVAVMSLHDTSCDARCVADQRHSALVLQLRALGLGSLVMLVSNILLLGFAVGLRGGRLDLATSRTAPRGVRLAADLDGSERFLPAALLGTAAIHATTLGRHLDQWPVAGIALLLLTILQVDAALLFLLRLRRVHLLVAAAVSAGPLVVWLYAHTAGLPVGPDAGLGEQLGLTDGTAALLEAATLVVASAALRHRRVPRRAGSRHATRLALTGVAAVTVVGVGVGLGVAGGPPAAASHHQGHHASS